MLLCFFIIAHGGKLKVQIQFSEARYVHGANTASQYESSLNPIING